ncbi:hypothetical protein H671_3g10948, partial [Cricetulus griseus]
GSLEAHIHLNGGCQHAEFSRPSQLSQEGKAVLPCPMSAFNARTVVSMTLSTFQEGSSYRDPWSFAIPSGPLDIQDPSDCGQGPNIWYGDDFIIPQPIKYKVWTAVPMDTSTKQFPHLMLKMPKGGTPSPLRTATPITSKGHYDLEESRVVCHISCGHHAIPRGDSHSMKNRELQSVQKQPDRLQVHAKHHGACDWLKHHWHSIIAVIGCIDGYKVIL